jgi:hypothetical protein
MTTGRAALACHQSHVHNPNKSLCRPQSSSASRVTAAAPPSVAKNFRRPDVACHVTLRLGVIHAMEGRYHALAKERIILLRCESLEPPMSQLVIHVIPAIPACPVRPKSGHSANARVYARSPESGRL